jgi:spore maturation protein CgeB
MACGASVLTSENLYMMENVPAGKSILYYKGDAMESIDGKLKALLDNEDQRKAIAKNGRDIVMQSHTWDNRAAQLIKDLDPIVKRIKESKSVHE